MDATPTAPASWERELDDSQAERHVDALRQHYAGKGFIEALRNLDRALTQAETRIEANPAGVLSAPRPYPHLAREDVAWVHAEAYWIAYTAPIRR